MRLSAAGLQLIKQSEGFRSTTYLDTAGLPTIGFGHRLQPGETFPNGIDAAEATLLLIADAANAEDAVDRMVETLLTQGQFDALTDFVFNLGAGRLASSTLLKCLNEGRYEDAAQQLLLWDHCGAGQNAGLKARRQAELQLWSGAAAPCSAV